MFDGFSVVHGILKSMAIFSFFIIFACCCFLEIKCNIRPVLMNIDSFGWYLTFNANSFLVITFMEMKINKFENHELRQRKSISKSLRLVLF